MGKSRFYSEPTTYNLTVYHSNSVSETRFTTKSVFPDLSIRDFCHEVFPDWHKIDMTWYDRVEQKMVRGYLFA